MTSDSKLNKNKQIVFVLGSMLRGGAEKVISLLANHYAELGWQVDIIVILHSGIGYTLDPSIRVIEIHTDESVPRICRAPKWIRGIRNFIRQNDSYIIVSFGSRINVIVLLASIGLKRHIIISERNDPRHDNRGWIGDMMTKILYPFASKIIFQTKSEKSYFSKRIQKKGVIILNPISVEVYVHELQIGKIVNIGKLQPQKNHAMLINAFAKVHQVHPEFILHIFGEGELQSQLEMQIHVLGLDGSVLLRGNLKNIHEEIADAQMFILSSDFEGLSNALLEAMMMGLPCISTDYAGSDEVITHEENGLLVPIGDADQMAAAIEKLIRDDTLANRLAINAKRSSARFNKDSVLEMWDQVIGG